MLPLFGTLSIRRSSPPSMRAISRLIDKPSPVPPYLRAVPLSACWKASKMIFCLSADTPMPVSVIVKPTTPSLSSAALRPV